MPDQDAHIAGFDKGELLAGKYRLDAVLGEGGMGVVVAAHHIHLDEKVAIKFLLPASLKHRDAVARFSREARAAARIKSPHVARVSDVGVLDNGTWYMVMEHLEGQDLAAWLSERGPLSVEQTVDFVLQACEALAEAHSLGIVHRDLKPSNFFVARLADGGSLVKVLDFGISKAANPDLIAADMTSTKAVMGSPFYMSPEQMISSREVDHRTDIWALGVVLFELLTDRTPFEAENLTQLCLQIANDDPPLLRQFRADAPAELERVISRCLQKDRTARYANIAELCHALAGFAPVHSRTSLETLSKILSRTQPSGEAATQRALKAAELGMSGTHKSWGSTSRGNRGLPWPLLLLGLTLAAGTAVALLLRTSSSAVPGSAAASIETGAAAQALPLEPATVAMQPAVPQPPQLRPAGEDDHAVVELQRPAATARAAPRGGIASNAATLRLRSAKRAQTPPAIASAELAANLEAARAASVLRHDSPPSAETASGPPPNALSEKAAREPRRYDPYANP